MLRKYILIIIMCVPILSACVSSEQYEDYVFFIDQADDYKIHLINDFEDQTEVIIPKRFLEAEEELQLLAQSPINGTVDGFDKVDELNRLYKNNGRWLVSSSNRQFVFSIAYNEEIKGLLICDVVEAKDCKRLLFEEPVQELKAFNRSLEEDLAFIIVRNETNDSLYLVGNNRELVKLYESDAYAIDLIDYDLSAGQSLLIGLKERDQSDYQAYRFFDLNDFDPEVDEIDEFMTTIKKQQFNLPYHQSFHIGGLPFNDDRLLNCNVNRQTDIVSCKLINRHGEELESYINNFNVIGFMNEEEVMLSESQNIYNFNYDEKTIIKINDEPVKGLEYLKQSFESKGTIKNPFTFNTKHIGDKFLLSVENVGEKAPTKRYKTYVIDEENDEIVSDFNLPISSTDTYFTNKAVILRMPDIQDGRHDLVIYHKIFGEFKLPDHGHHLQVFDDGIYYLDESTIKFFDVRYDEEFTLTEGTSISSFDVTKVAKNHYLLAVYTTTGTNFIRYQNNEVIELDYVLSNDE